MYFIKFSFYFADSKDIKSGFDYLNRIDEQFTDDLDLRMYKCLLYYFGHEYTKSKRVYCFFFRDVKNSKYHENFICALKYMMDNKPMKAIANFETCYQIALKMDNMIEQFLF